MKTSRVQSHLERTFGRPLTVDEVAAMEAARKSNSGKRETAKAMRSAVQIAISHRLRTPYL